MGFMDFLMGKPAQQQATSTPTNMNPFTSALQGGVTSSANNLIKNGPPQYTGPLNADITGAETKQLGDLNAATGPGTVRDTYLNSEMNGDYLPGGAKGNPFTDAMIKSGQRRTMESLQEGLKNYAGQFVRGGQLIQDNTGDQGGSSAFTHAAAVLGRGAASTMGDIATGVLNNAYNTGRQLQQGAANLSMEDVKLMSQNLKDQALPRLIKEIGIERGMEVFKNHVAAILETLRTVGGIAMPVVANQSQMTGTGAQGGFLDALGKVSGIAFGGGGMFPGGVTGGVPGKASMF